MGMTEERKMKDSKENQVLFTQKVTSDGQRYLETISPWPPVWYINRYMMATDDVEARPLTLEHVIRGLVMNYWHWSLWRVRYRLRMWGFLATSPGECYSWKDWRWAFWRQRRLDRFHQCIDDNLESMVKRYLKERGCLRKDAH